MKKTYLLFLALILCIGSLKAQTDIVITEIAYNQAESGADSTEFIELFNKGLTAVDLEGYSFTAGIIYTFPAITIDPGDFVVLTIDSMAMVNTYGYEGAYQWDTGFLNDDGEGITFRNDGGGLVDAVTYNDVLPWPVTADGEGKTIVLCDPELNNAFGVNWTASETDAGIVVNGFDVFGSPGAIDGACIDCEETSSSISESACNSYTVPSGDETYTVSGIYEDVIPNAAGCDSVITIDLTILETTSTLFESTCDSYTVPSGDETYEVAGTYMDTLTNAAGCDSIITIELSIGEPSVSEFTEIACGSYTVPSGDETYEVSGVYMDTIPNMGGCDSVMTITVTITANSESEIVESVCESYTVPSGDETYVVSGVYTDTLTNAAGCDSLITIDLTVNMPSSSEITVMACGPYTVPSGDETYEVDGVYMDTIPTMAGCDSIITINITFGMGEPTESEITEVVCGSYTVPSGDETYEMSGVYLDTIPNAIGCDSLITINLTVNMSTESEISESTCGSYTVPSGDETYIESGVYMDTIPNMAGCDSIITIDLSIVFIDEGITATIWDLRSDQAGADYQWIDCDNDNAPIDGATDQIFVPEENGNYAVEVTVAGCTITTECANFSSASINGNTFDQVMIYPNPSTGLLNIETGQLTDVTINIVSLDGRIIYQTRQTSNELVQIQLESAPGVYFVQMQHDGAQKQFKLILQ